MTDTTRAAPSDAELEALWDEAALPRTVTKRVGVSFARAVLAKWGTPTAAPVAQENSILLTPEEVDHYVSEEMLEYFDGAYVDSGCARYQLICFASRIVEHMVSAHKKGG